MSRKRPRAAFSVALVGADGAGKSTIGRRLVSELDYPVKYLYMGDNPDSASHMLPTTRLLVWLRRLRGGSSEESGPPTADAGSRERRSSGGAGSSVKPAIWFTNRLAEEYFRALVAWIYQVRGYVVVSDRHYFADYYAYDIAPNARKRTTSSRIHGFLLRHAFPRPDLVVCLDAPARVLFARKPEGTVEALEQRRLEYFRIRDLVERFVVVDASREEEVVARHVAEVISNFRR